MTRRWLLGMLVCCGCGRFDFDEKPELLEDKPPTISYPSSIHAVVMQTDLLIAPEVSGAGLLFHVMPPLPDGVTLDPLNGKIKGVPLATEDRGVHIITATNEHGTASATIHFTALAGSVVDIRGDGADDDDGMNDVCKSTIGGGCTLRAAFDTVNHQPGKQLVILGPGIYTLDRSLAGLKNDIVIAGVGADKTIIRPLLIHSGYPLAFLEAPRALRLENLGVHDFSSSNGGALQISKGSFEAFGVTFKNNQAMGTKGGVANVEGGAKADFENTTFIGNRALVGSGWGGVFDGSGAGTRITVRKSTATDNSAVWGSFSHLQTGATLVLENSTLYDNQATRAGTLASPGGEYIIFSSTITHNSVLFDDSAGIYLYSSPARYTVANSIVAHNLDINGNQNNCNRNGPGTVLVSQGGNLFGDDAGDCGDALTENDVKQMDPLLDPKGLADNGGLTMTVALQPDSAALGRGTGCPKDDQRGVPRGLICDAGAFELP